MDTQQLKPETSVIIQLEEQCRKEITALLEKHGCTLQAEINIIPPFPSYGKINVVSLARKDNAETQEMIDTEDTVAKSVETICGKYECTGVAKFKVVGGVPGVIPLFIHISRLPQNV